MQITPHILTGLVIADKVDNFGIAIVASLISHHVLDLIPHDDPDLIEDQKTGRLTARVIKDGKLHINWRHIIIGLDLAIGMAAAVYFGLRSGELLKFGVCAFAAIFSDFIRAPYFFLGWNPWFLRIFLRIETVLHNKERSFWGKAVQFAVIINCLAILFNALDIPWVH